MYDLHNQGWESLRQLCLTIAREFSGRRSLDSGDGGRDGPFGHVETARKRCAEAARSINRETVNSCPK